jgi:MFS family permease
VAVGLVPGYAQIGIWGGVALTLLRVIQGIGVGGEWGGSVLLAMEWGSQSRRGFVASWPQFGAPLGLLLANGAIVLFNGLAGPGFETWGWRVPFLLSFALVGVGLYIRLGILETPVFAKLKAEQQLERAPVLAVLKGHWKEVILTALLRTSQQATFYLFTTFVLTYGTQALDLRRSELLIDVLVASALALFSVPFFGWISDKIGRKRMTLIGQAALLVWIFVYFKLLDMAMDWSVFLAIALALPVHDMQYGPQAAFIAESFPGKLRYSGASLGYQLASITAGGPAPLIALWLLNTYNGSWAIALYVAATVLVSMAAACMLPDRTRADIEAGPGASPG